jgi:hypothetical protein
VCQDTYKANTYVKYVGFEFISSDEVIKLSQFRPNSPGKRLEFFKNSMFVCSGRPRPE